MTATALRPWDPRPDEWSYSGWLERRVEQVLAETHDFSCISLCSRRPMSCVADLRQRRAAGLDIRPAAAHELDRWMQRLGFLAAQGDPDPGAVAVARWHARALAGLLAGTTYAGGE